MKKGREKYVKQDKPQYSTITSNPMFMEYYKKLGIVPDSEWSLFCETLARPLPTSFRITSTSPLRNYVSKYVRKFETLEFTEAAASGDTFRPPEQLPWYPGGLAWQTTVPRREIKKIPDLDSFRQFLLFQNDHGTITRQEAVSMLPPLFLDVSPHHKILDMCAAPGSKTSQLIEMLHSESSFPDGFIIANDLRPERSYMLVNQIQRLRSPSVIVSCHEAQNFPLLYQENKGGEPVPLFFDRILCDAPCSGDGTTRKNRDMCSKWNPAFGISQHRLQIRIAQRGLELLKIGGLMVYSTCSFNPLENEAVVMELLRRGNGSVSLVDVSEKYTNLTRCKGINSWQVMDKDGKWYTTYEDLEEEKRGRLMRSHFPPEKGEKFAEQLSRCIRILPYHQDTGGFFLAVFSKSKPMPPSTAFLKAQKYRMQKKAEGELKEKRDGEREEEENNSDEEGETEVEEEIEVAMMEELTFGKRTGKEDRHFLEKKFKKFTSEFLPLLDRCNSLYGFRDNFPYDQLLVRSEEATKIYIVSKSLMEVFSSNTDDRFRIVNMGLKLFTAHEGDATSAGYRISQESVDLILPFISKRIVEITHKDLITLLSSKDPFVEMFETTAKASLMTQDVGPCILRVMEDSSPCFGMGFAGWRGKTSARLLLPKPETQCLCFLLCTVTL